MTTEAALLLVCWGIILLFLLWGIRLSDHALRQLSSLQYEIARWGHERELVADREAEWHKTVLRLSQEVVAAQIASRSRQGELAYMSSFTAEKLTQAAGPDYNAPYGNDPGGKPPAADSIPEIDGPILGSPPANVATSAEIFGPETSNA